MMTAHRIAAMLLAANAIVTIIGSVGGGGNGQIERPMWLPSIWTRVAIPLIVGLGLWLGQRWAWWLAVAMCTGLLLWAGVASLMLTRGGFFTEAGATATDRVSRFLDGHMLTALALLLSPTGCMIGRN